MKYIDKLINEKLLGGDADAIVAEAISADGNGEVDIDLDNARVDNIPSDENTNIIVRDIARSLKVIPLPVKEIVGQLGQLGIDSTATLTKMGYDAEQYSSLEDFVQKQAGFLIKILGKIIPMINKKLA